MRAGRFATLILIFICISVAWMVLGKTIVDRTRQGYQNLGSNVQVLWGTPITQVSPRVTRGKVPVDVIASDLRADIDLRHRRRGLLWFPTYMVNFQGTYTLNNTEKTAQDFDVFVRFPVANGSLTNFVFTIDGKDAWTTGADGATMRVRLAPGQRATARLEYRAPGLESWRYSFDPQVQRVKDFKLVMRTNFERHDFPLDTVSPTTVKEHTFTWNCPSRLPGFMVGMQMPEKLNPGDIAARITMFAPVGLFFFFAVVLVFILMRGINLHPMHFLFLGTGFFAFHLLFAYLVDHVNVNMAFLIATAASLVLVVNYMRLVVGWRFALLTIGVAQLIYLILFSYAFFFNGYTGLAITIGAVLTLAFVMQVTGKVDWEAAFGGKTPPLPPPQPAQPAQG